MPPVVSISLQPRSDGVTLKDTFVNIRDTGEFVVNMVTCRWRMRCTAAHSSSTRTSTNSPRSASRRKRRSFVATPRVKDAPISLECKLERIIPMGGMNDHVVFGEVVRFHIRDDVYMDGGRIDTGALQAVGRLAAEYTLVHNAFTTPLDEELLARLPGQAGWSPRWACGRLFADRFERVVRLRRDALIPDTPHRRLAMTSVHPAAAHASRQPSLVFIHGFLDGAAVWDDVVQALGERAHDALRVDLPGMGGRAGERAPLSLAGFAEDVARQVRALDRPVVLVGQSMGAQVAELVAGDLASQVRALVLLTPVPLAGTGLPDEVMNTFRALGGNPAAQRDLRRNLSVNLDGDRLEKLGRLGDGVEAAAVCVFADLWNRGDPRGRSAQPL